MTGTENVRPPDPVAWDKYSDGGAGKPLPPKGEYTLVASKVELGRTNEGYLQATVDVTVQAPGTPHDGYLSRFNRFNTKNWPGKTTSGAADYLSAFGITGCSTDQEYEQAIQATLNRPFRAVLDWEIYDSATSYKLKGYDNFPTNTEGQKVSRVTHNGQTLFANVRIKYTISAIARKTA
jgi:hypothetical protein